MWYLLGTHQYAIIVGWVVLWFAIGLGALKLSSLIFSWPDKYQGGWIMGEFLGGVLTLGIIVVVVICIAIYRFFARFKGIGKAIASAVKIPY